MLHGAPLFLQLVLLPVIERVCLLIKPGIDALLRDQPLVNITCLIDQIEHNTIIDTLTELVSVNIATKHL